MGHKHWDMTLCFLVWPELLLFPSVRKIQTHTPLAIWPNLLRPGLFECFRLHTALIMKQFLAWSLASKIKDSVFLGCIPFSVLSPWFMSPNAHYIFQSMCFHHLAFGNCQILQFSIHPTYCCLSYLYKVQILFFLIMGLSNSKSIWVVLSVNPLLGLVWHDTGIPQKYWGSSSRPLQ